MDGVFDFLAGFGVCICMEAGWGSRYVVDYKAVLSVGRFQVK